MLLTSFLLREEQGEERWGIDWSINAGLILEMENPSV
jgi:hypothetical protein